MNRISLSAISGNFKSLRLFLSFVFILIAIAAFGQKQKDIDIIRECIEYKGDGKYQVNFGYDNPNSTEIDVPQENSILEKNSGNAYGHTKFKPGRQYNVFSEEFDYRDVVKWTVIFPDGKEKIVIADANSSHCSGDDNLKPLFDGANEGGVLWPELYWLAQQTDQPESNEIFQVDNSSQKVLIEVIAFVGMDMNTIRIELAKRGFSDEIPDGENPLVITGFFPINNLDFFNKNPLQNYVNFVRPMFTPVLGASDGLGDLYDYQGLVNTEQDIAMRSHIVRKAFNLSGDGVTIGVLSDSYGIPPDGSTDVPQESAIEIVRDLPDLGPFGGGTDEGRAMIEQAFDIAPGVNYKFWTGVGSPEHMALGIRTLADENLPYKCDIIVDDILHLGEPFMPKGQIADAVAEVTAAGVHYVSSAGNSRDAGFRGSFTPSDIPSDFTSFAGSTAKAHNFGNSNSDYPQIQEIKLTPGVYIIEMQWDDLFYAQQEGTGAQYDLDFWILDKFGNKKYYGNRLNQGEDPIEILGFEVLFPTELYVMITGENIPPSLGFEYIVLRAPLDENKEFGWSFSNSGDAFNATTIVGHSASDFGSTVGAAFYGYTPAFKDNYSGTEMLEAFSSRGGANLQGEELRKPDFIAPDGGNNTFFGSDINFDDDDGYNDNTPENPDAFFDGYNFFGTSAAAPAVAAMEALILQASKRVNDNSDSEPIKKEFTPSGLKTVLINSSLDVDLDQYSGGSGLVQADRALLTMANPSPKILALDFTETNPGLVEFTMKITMQYPVTNEAGDPIVYEEDELGVPVPNGATKITFLNETLSWQANTETNWDPDNYILEMTVNIPKFTENPEITLTNGAQDGTIEDSNGGTSSQKILDVQKEYVLIKAQPVTKLYGQDPPVYNGNTDGLTFDIYTRNASLEWVPSTEYEALKSSLISAIELNTEVTFDKEVGLYSIKINIVEGQDLVVEALTAEYNIVNFIDNGAFANLGDGAFTVNPLPVTVKPKDILNAIYGEKININLQYLFHIDNMADTAAVRSLIKASHDALLAPPDFFVIADRGAQLIDRGAQLIDRGAQLIDEETGEIIDRGAQLIDGSSWMMTKEVFNRGAALIDGGNTVFEIGIQDEGDFLLDDPTSAASNLDRGAALIDASAILTDPVTIFDRGAQLVDASGAVIDRGAALIDRGAALIDAEEKAGEDFKLFLISSDDEPENTEGVYNLNFETMQSVNFVSGLDVLPTYNINSSPYKHFIAPGTLLNKNLIVSYEIGDLVFKARDISIQVEDIVANKEKIFGIDDPIFTKNITAGSLIPEILPNNDIPNDPGNLGDTFFGSLTREPGEDVDTYDIKLGDLKAGPIDGILDINEPIIPFGLNYNITLEGDPKFKIIEASAYVIFENESLTKTYDGSAQEPTVTTLPLDRNVVLTYTQDVDGETVVLGSPPVNAGIYQVTVELFDEPNYVISGSNTATFTIGQAPVTLNFDDLAPTFNGLAQEPTVTTTPAFGDLDVELSYKKDEVDVDPANVIDAGTYLVTVQLSNDNYSISGAISTPFTIGQAPVTLNFDDLTPTFNGLAQEPTVTTTPAFGDLDVELSYKKDEVDVDPANVIDAGTYLVTVQLSNDNYSISGAISTPFTIGQAPVTLNFDDLTPTFNGLAQEPTVTTTPAFGDLDVELSYKKDEVDVDPANVIDAGTYLVTVQLSNDNYSISGAISTDFIINPAKLYITATQKETFFEGDTDLNAVFEFTVTGFIGNLGTLDIGVAVYAYPSDIPAGNYPLQYNSTLPNYEIVVEGMLYVNPFGSSTPNVHPRLDCIEETPPGSDYPFVAHMYHENPNSTTLFIPYDTESNKIYYASGNGSFEVVNPTEYFYPGAHSFDIYFDGNKLIYSLTSYKTELTAAISSDASSGSNRCSDSGARLASTPEDRKTSTFDLANITGYPNPVSDLYYISLSEAQVSSVNVNLVDIQGKIYDVRLTRNPSRRRLEIDLANVNSGLYLLKLDFDNDQKILKVIKQ